MGQAKKRGTFEQRSELATIKREAAQAVADHKADMAYNRRQAAGRPRHGATMLAAAMLAASMPPRR